MTFLVSYIIKSIFAGEPTTIAYGSTSFVTTELAATIAPSPITTHDDASGINPNVTDYVGFKLMVYLKNYWKPRNIKFMVSTYYFNLWCQHGIIPNFSHWI